MKVSPFYSRIVDVMEELVKFSLLARDIKDQLVDRYSKHAETLEQLSIRANTPGR